MTKRTRLQKLRLRAQQGTVLIVALVFLVVLTLVAVVAMRTTTLDMKIATNTMLRMRAFENSEGARAPILGLMDAHMFNRGWPDSIGGDVPASAGMTIPAGMDVLPAGAPEDVYQNNNVELDELGDDPPTFYDPDNEDMQYRLDGNVDGDFTDSVDVNADLFVTRVGVGAATGGAQRQAAGTLGAGKGTAGAGSAVFFDVRSRGASVDSTVAFTGSDLRIVIRN